MFYHVTRAHTVRSCVTVPTGQTCSLVWFMETESSGSGWPQVRGCLCSWKRPIEGFSGHIHTNCSKRHKRVKGSLVLGNPCMLLWWYIFLLNPQRDCRDESCHKSLSIKQTVDAVMTFDLSQLWSLSCYASCVSIQGVFTLLLCRRRSNVCSFWHTPDDLQMLDLM